MCDKFWPEKSGRFRADRTSFGELCRAQLVEIPNASILRDCCHPRFGFLYFSDTLIGVRSPRAYKYLAGRGVRLETGPPCGASFTVPCGTMRESPFFKKLGGVTFGPSSTDWKVFTMAIENPKHKAVCHTNGGPVGPVSAP